MESGTLPHVMPAMCVPAQRAVAASVAAVRAISDQSTPDEPTAVLVVGAHERGKRELVRALLGAAGEVVDVPPATYLVISHGPAGAPRAHVPGHRKPQRYGPAIGGPTGGGPASGGPAVNGGATGGGSTNGRPPRRVEISLPRPLLRHFTLVQAPCTQRLGAGGGAVLAAAAERGGAVVFVATADQPLTRSELDLLTELSSRDISVFFAIVADGDADRDPVGAALAAHRAAVAGHAPELAGAAWFPVDPSAGDVAYLRRALVDWAGAEALRRAGGNPPVLPVAGTVHIAERAADSGWSEALDRWRRAGTRLVRQRLAIEVAGIHLRCVQDLIFGAGCAGLPEALDHELHALSQRATAECDTATAGLVHDVLLRVLDTEPTEDVRQRVVTAVRRGLATDVVDRELARVLLVTGTGGVAVVAGEESLAALPGYATVTAPAILPPVGLAVSGGCYALWRDSAREPAGARSATGRGEVARARSWLQGVTRAVELELLREVGRRFDAVNHSLGCLIGESVDHGILLA